MKKLLLTTSVIVTLAACNSNSESAAGNEDPNKVHPVSETIPDSMKLANDSVIVPDVQPGSSSDDSAKNAHEGMNH